jgi:hypothetical protein
MTCLLAILLFFQTRTVGDAPLIYPHFAQGGGYQTTFTFNNLSNTTATITLGTFSQAGALLNSTTLIIPANGSARSALTGTTLSVGWARATATPAVDFVGTETIQLFASNGSLVMEASVLAAPADTKLKLPVFEKDGFGTGVALLNPTGAAAALTVTLRSNLGLFSDTTTINLSGSQQTAKFVSEMFPGLGSFEGTLEVSSQKPVAALALRQNFASGIFSTLPVTPSPSEAYFSPRAGIASRIVQEIQLAQNTIDIAIYSFTRNEIADALIAAKARGVQIRILADTSQAAGLGSDIARLETAGLPLKRTDGAGGGIMHHKVAIFDSRLLLTGSYNWSTAAEDSNDENALFLRDNAVVSAYQLAFNALWSSR